MDPYVIDLPLPVRWFLVNAVIVPRRSRASSRLYRKIWMEEGSPLFIHTMKLGAGVQANLGNRYHVKACMRYGFPSIEKAVKELKGEGVTKVFIVPLYPQYSAAATESALTEALQQLERAKMEADYLRYFFDSEAYLSAVTQVSAPILSRLVYDHVLFSFHGLPEKQIRKPAPHCYREQCFQTAERLASRLFIKPDQYSVCFQSRLSRAWIKPFTDEFYRTLPQRGIKKIVVFCPSFVADCLETLEEVAIRGKEEFLRHGGKELHLIASLNAEDIWVDSLSRMIQEKLPA